MPEKGRANAALLGLLRDALGVPLSAMRIESGALSREKRVRIETDDASLGDALRALPGSGGKRGDGEPRRARPTA